jgi:hypothetical protein
VISIRELRFCALQRPRTVSGGLHQPNQPIEQEGGLRQRKLEIELQFRKKTADQILDSDILQFDGASEKMRINDRIDSVEDFFTTIKATEI